MRTSSSPSPIGCWTGRPRRARSSAARALLALALRIEEIVEHRPRLASVGRILSQLPDGPIPQRRQRQARGDPALSRTLPVALQPHRSVLEGPVELRDLTLIVHPGLMPLLG